MRLFRPLLHIWHTLIANLFTVIFQEASKPCPFDLIQVGTMQVLDDVIGKVKGALGDTLLYLCPPLLRIVRTEHLLYTALILSSQLKKIFIQQFGKILEMDISLLAHWFLSFSAQYTISRKEVACG